jgi:hypothetical protein
LIKVDPNPISEGDFTKIVIHDHFGGGGNYEILFITSTFCVASLF